MLMTHHAKTRMQQRSIPPLIASWLEYYGEEAQAPGGATVLYFSKRSRQMIRGDVGSVIYNRIKNLLNTYQVLYENKVITAGRRYKKIHLQA